MRTLYACFTQSEHVIYVGMLGTWPVRSIGSWETILSMLRVPTTSWYSSSREVAQSVLFEVLENDHQYTDMQYQAHNLTLLGKQLNGQS